MSFLCCTQLLGDWIDDYQKDVEIILSKDRRGSQLTSTTLTAHCGRSVVLHLMSCVLVLTVL